MYEQPPETNVIMALMPCTKDDLQDIMNGFIPTDDQSEVSIFYIAATWNRLNTEAPINGDTVEFLLR